MSTTPESTSIPKTTSSQAFVHTSESFDYAVTHVFLPLELPNVSDYTLEKDLSLVRAAHAAICAYSQHVCSTPEKDHWHRITEMLDNLLVSAKSVSLDRDQIISQLSAMRTGGTLQPVSFVVNAFRQSIDILTFFVRPQNAAIILTKQEDSTLCTSFRLSPDDDAVEEAVGSLICSYPSSAVRVQNEVFEDENFQFELANFLSPPSLDFPRPPLSRPQYITALLTGILRGVGRTDDVTRVTKRIRDNVGGWPHRRTGGNWRRSSLWLLVRVAIQTSLDHSPRGRACYKQFMLYFVCTLARDGNNGNVSSDLLQQMSHKIFRRLSKLGSTIPGWLSELALTTCTCLRATLDARWEELSTRPSLFQAPSEDELIRNTQLSLINSREYIQNVLTNPFPEPPVTPFRPSHRRRGTLQDFLSSNGSFFEEACHADLFVSLYDFEQAVEQEIDDWLACVTDVEEACAQLEISMDKYLMRAFAEKLVKPEDASVRLLTAIELHVALDKLAVKETPMLVDYSPEIPIAFLERMLLRKTTSLHQLSCAYQYLSARHSQSRSGWSVLSNEFNEVSFPVRYYDQSPHLQQLKARIDEDGRKTLCGQAGPWMGGVNPAHTHDECQEYQQRLSGKWLAESVEVSQPSLPTSPLHAKAVVFELQCPPHIRIWRSSGPRILFYFSPRIFQSLLLTAGYGSYPSESFPGPALLPYFVEPPESFIHAQIFTRFYLESPNSPIMRYSFGQPHSKYPLIWCSGRHYSDHDLSQILTHELPPCNISHYMCSALHTPNDVLAAQADCPADFFLDEFVAFAQLWSGGLLQWFNILHGLHSRTLNLHRPQVHYLLSHVALQVGPLDLNTGSWTWHQELQDPFFCNALLDNLESLFTDVGTTSVDNVLMSTISLLLTRVLASSLGDDVSDCAITLLRTMRRRTFTWTQELSYDFAKAPTKRQRSTLLVNMAITCQSTFDVDAAVLRKLFCSAEDVDALLTCAFFTHALAPVRCKFNFWILISNT